MPLNLDLLPDKKEENKLDLSLLPDQPVAQETPEVADTGLNMQLLPDRDSPEPIETSDVKLDADLLPDKSEEQKQNNSFIQGLARTISPALGQVPLESFPEIGKAALDKYIEIETAPRRFLGAEEGTFVAVGEETGVLGRKETGIEKALKKTPFGILGPKFILPVGPFKEASEIEGELQSFFARELADYVTSPTVWALWTLPALKFKALKQYNKIQGVKLNEFVTELSDDLVLAGVDKARADRIAHVETYKMWTNAKPLDKTPGSINKSINIMRNNKDQIVKNIKNLLKQGGAATPTGEPTVGVPAEQAPVKAGAKPIAPVAKVVPTVPAKLDKAVVEVGQKLKWWEHFEKENIKTKLSAANEIDAIPITREEAELIEDSKQIAFIQKGFGKSVGGGNIVFKLSTRGPADTTGVEGFFIKRGEVSTSNATPSELPETLQVKELYDRIISEDRQYGKEEKITTPTKEEIQPKAEGLPPARGKTLLEVKPEKSLEGEAKKFDTAEGLPQGLKQYFPAYKQAEIINEKLPNSNIEVYGSFSTLKRVGGKKKIPDVDVLIEDEKIAQQILNLPENIKKIKSRTTYAKQFNARLGKEEQDRAFKTPFHAVGQLDMPENLEFLSNKSSDVKIKINNLWYSVNPDKTFRLIEGALQEEQLVNRKPIKQALTDIFNKAKEAKVAPVKAKPIKKEIKVEEPKKFGVTVKDVETLRKKFKLEDVPLDQARKWKDVFNNALKRKSEVKFVTKSILDKPRVLENEEFASLAIRRAELEDIIDAAEINAEKAIDTGNKAEQERFSNVSNGALEELEEITAALRWSNREAGRALNIVKITLEREGQQYRVAKLIQKAKLAKGEKLTTEETNKLKTLAKKIKEFEVKETELQKEIDDLQEKLAKSDAKQNFVKTSRTISRARTTVKLKVERESLFSELNKLGFRVNDVVGVTYESAKVISKLATNYFESGIKDVEKIAEQITNKIPDLTKKDVYDSLGGRIKRTKQIVVSDTKKGIADLKIQARLMGQIEDAFKGVFDRLSKGKIPSDKVRALRKKLKILKESAEKATKDEKRLRNILTKIDSLSDQLKLGVKNTAKRKIRVDPEKIQQAKNKLSEFRRLLNLKDTITKLENQIKTGKKEIKNGRRVDSKEIQQAKNKIIELRRELQKKTRISNLKEKISELEKQVESGEIVKKQKRIDDDNIKNIKQDLSELRRLIDSNAKIADLENQLRTSDFKVPIRTRAVIKNVDLLNAQVKLAQLRREAREQIHRLRPRTRREIFVDIASLPRELMATADFSGVGRQAAILSTLDPIAALKITKESLPSFFSQDKADEIDLKIKQHENQPIRVKAGLKIKSMENIKFSDREEDFISSMGEKIPLWGQVVKASNRHMVSHLNLIRTMSFDRFLNLYPNATDEELKNWANYVNIASGIGDLGAFNKVASELSIMFFSPRFSASRIQLPYEGFKYKATPRVRKEIAKNYMKFLSMVGLSLLLADMGGAKVELNPQSSDWLKIKIGDTRIDLWGGLQQPARLTVVSMLKVLSTTGAVKLDKDVDLFQSVARFLRYKLSPAISLPLELAQGRNAIGQKVNPLQSMIKNFTPLVAEEIVETYSSNPLLGAILAPFILLGVGVNTFGKRGQSSGTDLPISKLNPFKTEEAFASDVVDMKVIATIESSNNRKAFNKSSGAKGLHQVTKAAVDDWNNWHRKDKFNYNSDQLFNSRINTRIATWYMTVQIPRILANKGVPATLENMLVGYNAGPGFARTWYNNGADKSKLPKETRDYLKKYERDINKKQ